MATTAVDPLQLLQAALTAPENTKEQADLLASLRETLELHPAPIPILVHTLIRKVTDAEDSLLKRWIFDLLHFALGRSTLSIEQRTQSSSPFSLHPDLYINFFRSHSGLASPRPTRAAARRTRPPLCESSYPMPDLRISSTVPTFVSQSRLPLLWSRLTRLHHRCINRSNPTPWHTLTACKNRIIDMVWSTGVNAGVKLSAMKFVQRVILVQTRGVQDPRVVIYKPSLAIEACNPEIFVQFTASKTERPEHLVLPC